MRVRRRVGLVFALLVLAVPFHLLASPRPARKQVKLTVRVVRVDPKTFGDAGLEAVHHDKKTPGVAFLDDAKLLRLMEKVQASQASSVMQSPTLVVEDGREGTFQVGEGDEGTRCACGVMVSKDASSVLLRLKMSHKAEGDETATTVKKFLALADGRTAVLTSDAGRCTETIEVAAPAVVERVPYLNRLFKNRATAVVDRHTVLTITANILGDEDVPPPTTAPATPEELAGPPPVPPPAAVPGDGAKTVFVRNKRFDLTYTLADVGTSGVSELEVWWTRDDGCWHRFPDKVRASGRVPVVAPGEGRLGFTLLPRSGAGLRGKTPTQGDKPQIVVDVDNTEPTVKLAPVSVGGAPGEEAVTLRWSATDRNLADAPVTIRYAPAAEGPWAVLAAGLEANGSATWSDVRLPVSCHFRVEAADRAGNIGSTQTREAVRIDLKVPRVENVGVAVTEESRTLPAGNSGTTDRR